MAQNTASVATDAHTAKTVALNAVTKIGTATTKAFNIALAIGAGIAISYVSIKLFEWFNDVTHATENAVKAMNEANDTVSNLKTNLQEHSKVIKECKDRYAELSKGVNSFNNKNISLNSDDYKEFLSLSNRLAETFPQITSGVDDNGNAILNLSGDVDTIVSSLDQLIIKERELANIDIIKSMPNIFKGVNAEVDDYKNKINDLKNQLVDLSKEKTETSSNSIPITITGNGDAYIQKVIKAENTLQQQMLEQSLSQMGVDYSKKQMMIEDTSGTYPKNESYISYDFTMTDEQEQEVLKRIQDQSTNIQEEYNTQAFKINKEIYAYEQKIQSSYDSLNSVTDAWLQSDYRYSNLNDGMKSIVDTLVNGIDFKALGLDTEEKMEEYIYNSIINPLFYASPEVTEAFNQLLDMKDKLESGEISNTDFTEYANSLFGALFENMGTDESDKFKTAFINGFRKTGIEGNNFDDVLNGVISNWLSTSKNTTVDIGFDFFSSDYKESIDNYKQELQNLSKWQNEYLTNGFLSTESLYDLRNQFSDIFDFSEFDMTGNYSQMFVELKDAIIDNVIEPLNDLMNTEGVSDSTKNSISTAISMIQKLSNEMYNGSDAIDSYNTSLDNMQSAFETVSSAIDEYKNKGMLSLDTIQSLLKLDNKYINVLFDENGELQLNTQAYQELAVAKLNNIAASICADAMETANTLTDETSAIDYLRENTDLLTDATWDGVVANIAYAESQLTQSEAEGNNVDNQRKALDALQENTKSKLELIKQGLANISKDFNDFVSGENGTTKSENVFDWASNSIDNLNRSIDNLNTKLESTDSFEDRLAIYDDLKTANDELVSSTEKVSSAYETVWKQKSANISSKYKNQIMSDKVFSVQEFSDIEEYNKIVEAQKAYQEWQSSLQATEKAKQQRDNDEDEKLQLLNEQKQLQIDLLDLNIKDSVSSNRKNQLLEKEKVLQGDILANNLLLAKTEEERLKLQEEYKKNLEDIDNQEYENTRTERDNRISYWESRIQDYQNDIALNESKDLPATEYQYAQQNKIIEEHLKPLYTKQYDDALANRNAQKYGTDLWKKYNDEVQDAENNLNNCEKEIIANNKAIAALPLETLKKENEQLEENLKVLEKCKEKVEASIAGASSLIQEQIDYQNELKENTEDSYKAQIKVIQEKIDAMSEENEAQKNQLELEKAKYNLDKAMNEKTTKVYHEGEGFVYESDYETVRDAKESYDTALYNNELYKLNAQKTALEKTEERELEIIDKELKSLSTYKESLDKITENWQTVYNLQVLMSQLGDDVKERILSGDYSVVGELTSLYNNAQGEITSTQEKIDENNNTLDSATNFIKSWNGASNELPGVLNTIKDTIKNNTEIDKAIDEKVGKVTSVATEWSNNNIKIKDSLDLLNKNYTDTGEKEALLLQGRLNNIKAFATNAKTELDKVTESLSSLNSSLPDTDSIQLNINADLSPSQTTSATTSSNAKKVGKSHTGMELGFIGEGNKKTSQKQFQYVSLNELKSDEIPRILQIGEGVLNLKQQENILSNLKNSFVSGLQLGAIKSPTTSANNLVFNGDINICDPIGDTDTLAKAIKLQLPSKFMQEIYRE